jgi:hypothetical protein
VLEGRLRDGVSLWLRTNAAEIEKRVSRCGFAFGRNDEVLGECRGGKVFTAKMGEILL